ncbi:hypothetical protein CANMA_001958 [Candida margitis]|uniref:uncharacterized protein n=1 Tax=Candida margitis TaxID=1775924 RepID=UPI002226954C|nr:uncharacterized protein CANMA_001958 [Candida margitis]KAI5968962.1 hypothetical protein CANMA_001958 [Candida margitis]
MGSFDFSKVFPTHIWPKTTPDSVNSASEYGAVIQLREQYADYALIFPMLVYTGGTSQLKGESIHHLQRKSSILVTVSLLELWAIIISIIATFVLPDPNSKSATDMERWCLEDLKNATQTVSWFQSTKIIHSGWVYCCCYVILGVVRGVIIKCTPWR